MATDDKISGMIFPADDKAKVSSNDSQTGFLASKLVAGANVTITENNNGANETLTISALGGVTGFTASVNTAAPNNTVNAARLLVNVPTTDGDLVLQPKGTNGSIMLQVPDGAITGGNKRGFRTIDLGVSRNQADRVCSGTSSAILGGDGNICTGSNSVIAGGREHIVNGNYAGVGAGNQNQANNYAAYVGGGVSNVVSGEWGVVAGGASNTVNSPFGGCIPGGVHAVATRYGQYAWSSGRFTAFGDCQQEKAILRRVTTDATVTELTADGSIPTTTTRITILSDATYTYEGLITARRADADNESAGWKIQGVIDNNAGTTAFVGTPTITVIGDDSGGAWLVTVSADNTNDCLKIDVQGQTGKTIRWAAYVNLMKVAG